MTSAGRILIMPKGDYNAETTYEMLDLVYHGGRSWLSKKTVVGIEPSAANSEYWHNMFDFDPSAYLLKEGGELTGNIHVKRAVPACVLEVNETHTTTLHKNASENMDAGTALIDKTGNVRTILTIQNGALRLFKQVDGVEVGGKLIAEIKETTE